MTDTTDKHAHKLVQACLDQYNERTAKPGVVNIFDGHPTEVVERAAEHAEKEAEAVHADAKTKPEPGRQVFERFAEMFSEIAEDARTELEAREREQAGAST